MSRNSHLKYERDYQYKDGTQRNKLPVSNLFDMKTSHQDDTIYTSQFREPTQMRSYEGSSHFFEDKIPSSKRFTSTSISNNYYSSDLTYDNPVPKKISTCDLFDVPSQYQNQQFDRQLEDSDNYGRDTYLKKTSQQSYDNGSRSSLEYSARPQKYDSCTDRAESRNESRVFDNKYSSQQNSFKNPRFNQNRFQSENEGQYNMYQTNEQTNTYQHRPHSYSDQIQERYREQDISKDNIGLSKRRFEQPKQIFRESKPFERKVLYKSFTPMLTEEDLSMKNEQISPETFSNREETKFMREASGDEYSREESKFVREASDDEYSREETKFVREASDDEYSREETKFMREASDDEYSIDEEREYDKVSTFIPDPSLVRKYQFYPPSPEEMGSLFKGMVILFSFKRKNVAEKNPFVLICESFRRSDRFSSLEVEDGYQFKNKHIRYCTLRYNGMMVVRGVGENDIIKESRVRAGIQLINNLAMTCYTLKMKNEYFSNEAFEKILIEKERPGVFRVVPEEDCPDMDHVKQYINNFFQHDSDCELVFTKANLIFNIKSYALGQGYECRTPSRRYVTVYKNRTPQYWRDKILASGRMENDKFLLIAPKGIRNDLLHKFEVANILRQIKCKGSRINLGTTDTFNRPTSVYGPKNVGPHVKKCIVPWMRRGGSRKTKKKAKKIQKMIEATERGVPIEKIKGFNFLNKNVKRKIRQGNKARMKNIKMNKKPKIQTDNKVWNEQQFHGHFDWS